MELTNKETGEEIKVEPASFAIMPYDEQVKIIDLPSSLGKGNYLLVSLLDAGSEYNLKVAEKDIHVE